MSPEPPKVSDLETLYDFLTNPTEKRSLKKSGLVIVRETFREHLDLSNIKFPVPLIFRHCTFAAGLRMKGTRLPFLQLDDCTIVQGFAARDLELATTLSAQRLTADAIDLTDAVIGGNMEMSGARIGANLGQDAGRCIHGAEYFTRELEHWVALSFDRARIAGSFYLNSCGKPPCGNHAVPGDPNSRRTEIHGCVSMRNAKIDGAFVASGAKFLAPTSIGNHHDVQLGNREAPAIRASGCTIAGAVFLCAWPGAENPRDETKFDATGAIEFQFADLKDRLIVGRYTEAFDANKKPNDVTNGPFWASLTVHAKKDHRGADLRPALRLTSARIAGGVQIHGVTMKGGLDIETIKLGRSLDIRFTKIEKPHEWQDTPKQPKPHYALYADGARIAHSLIVESAVLDGEVSLIEAEVAERLMMSHVEITGPEDTARPHSAIFARGANFGAVHLEDHSAIGGKGDGNGSVVAKGTVSFAVCRVRDDLRLTDLKVHTDGVADQLLDRAGMVDLSFAQIGGCLQLAKLYVGPSPDCSSAPHKTLTAIAAANCSVSGNLETKRLQVCVASATAFDLSNANVKGRWNAKKIRVRRYDDHKPNLTEQVKFVAIQAPETKFGGSVVFGGESAGAYIFGTMNFTGAYFAQDIIVANGEYGPPCTWDPKEKKPKPSSKPMAEWRSFPILNLARAQIDGDFVWGRGAMNKPRPLGIVSLQAAHISRLDDNPDWWPRGRRGIDELSGYWRLDGCTYDRIHHDALSIDRGPWLESQDPERLSLQPYDHLERVLKGAGLTTESQKIAISRQNAKRRRTWMKLRTLDTSHDYVAADWEWIEATRRDMGTRAALSILFVLMFCCFGVAGLIELGGYILGSFTKGHPYSVARPYPLDFIALSISGGLLLSVLLFALRVIDRCLAFCPHPASAPPPSKKSWKPAPPEIRTTAIGRIIWFYALEGLTGYGHRLRRLFIASVAWMLFAGALFHVVYQDELFLRSQAATLVGYESTGTLGRPANSTDDSRSMSATIRPEPLDPKSGNDSYPKFNPFLYSIDLFVPFLEIHQDAYWTLSGKADWYWKALKIFHIAFGWFALFLVASSPFQVFRKE